MAIKIREDMVRGSRTFWNLTDGIRATRVFLVSGLPNEPTSNVGYRALTASSDNPQPGDIPRIPRVGEAHPKIKHMSCDTADAEPFENSVSTMWVTCGYIDSAPIVRINGTIVRELTRRDRNNNIMEVVWTPEAPPTFVPERNQERGRRQIVELEILRPGLVLEFDMWERDEIPGYKAEAFVGSVNADPFQGKPPKTWMCTAVEQVFSVRSYNRPQRRRYQFTFRGFGAPSGGGLHDTWATVGMYVDPHLRRVPRGVDPKAAGFPNEKEGNGWKQFDLYPEIPFDRFDFPNVFSATQTDWDKFWQVPTG